MDKAFPVQAILRAVASPARSVASNRIARVTTHLSELISLSGSLPQLLIWSMDRHCILCPSTNHVTVSPNQIGCEPRHA